MNLHQNRASLGHNRRDGRSRVYAIACDSDVQLLEELYPNPSWRNGYSDARRFLEDNGFENKQGSGYFSLEDIGPVECVAAVQNLAELTLGLPPP